MTSIISLAEGDDCILSKTKEIHNPITGEVSYSNVDLCKATVKEYIGNKCILTINEIINKDDMNNIESDSHNGLILFNLDGSNIKSNEKNKSEVLQKAENQIKKQEKSEKRKALWNKVKEAGKSVGKGFMDNLKVSTK